MNNSIIEYTTKMMKSVKMRDARKYLFIGCGFALVIDACNRYSKNVMDKDYNLTFNIGNCVTIHLHKQDKPIEAEVIDVAPNNLIY